jgi:diphosphomevalonate decarboxylase
MKLRATAIAHPNIALIKYWGKRDQKLNLPAAGSLSLTLDGLTTRTSIHFDHTQNRDLIILNGNALSGRRAERITLFLDILREAAGVRASAVIHSDNDFPTGAGLASSSSGFAALAAAAAAALDLNLTLPQLSVLARMGSGSAARSVLGGFVEMKPGHLTDGSDAHAVPIASQDHWNLRCLVAITAAGEKSIGSTEAMNQTALTSPYYDAWIQSVPDDIERARLAIAHRDFPALGRVAEHSCLKFHASAIAADPGILYWNGLTLQIVHKVRQLRDEGMRLFFTIDAGPHVKIFCESTHMSAIKGILRTIPGVQQILTASPGAGVRLEDEQGRLSTPWASA